MTTYLLYPDLVAGKNSDPPSATIDNYFEDLRKDLEKLMSNNSLFRDIQKATFSANYDVRLTPIGFQDDNPKFVRAKPDSRDYAEFYQHKNVIIQSYEATKNYTWKENAPLTFISSPYSGAKIISNITNKVDTGTKAGTYMIEWGSDSRWWSVISGQIPGREGKITSQGFYPLSHSADHNSIDITAGNLNDLVLFDGSHNDIYLKAGDDVAIPSLASYQPSIKYGENLQKKLSNVPTIMALYGTEFGYKDNKIFASNEKDLLLNGYAVSQSKTNQKTNIAPPEKREREPKIIIGGQRIHGEAGNDYIYGYDPILYAGTTASQLGSTSGAGKINGPIEMNFFDEDIAIEWRPLLLTGGPGRDTFDLGDINRLNLNASSRIDSSHKNGSTLYNILGDKKPSELGKKNRIDKSWGENLEADIFKLSAHYSNYSEQTLQKAFELQYPDNNKIDTNTKATAASSAGYVASSIMDIISAISSKISPKFSLALNAVSGLIDLAVAIKDIIPSKKSDKFYQSEDIKKVVPPGEWRNAITVSDWDPYDRFSIDVIPLLGPNIEQSEPNKWENVNFSIENNNSQTSKGFKISMETAGGNGKNSPLAYLDGLQAPNQSAEYGYSTYNFFTGRDQHIDPLKDMSYFGVLTNLPSEKLSFKENYKEEAFLDLEISKDSSLFLWDSPTLRKKGLLNKYRAASMQLEIGIDSRLFGWYTDLVLDKEKKEIDLRRSSFNHWDKSTRKWIPIPLSKLLDPQLNPQSRAATNAGKAGFTYWTAQDTYGNKLMNLKAADTDNTNDVEFYKVRDDGSVLDPITGKWLAPSAAGYEKAALSETNYAGALGVQQKEDGTTKLIVEEGFKLAPFIETTFGDGRVDHIFVYNEVHANDSRHTRDSMVQIADNGVIRFEDIVGGDYDYNDAVLDPSLYPELAAHLAPSLLT